MSGRACYPLAFLLLILSTPLYAEKPAQPERELIGEVLGKPVYRDEIGSSFTSDSITVIGSKVNSRLRHLFLSPLLKKYKEENQAEIEPTEKDLKIVAEHLIKTVLTKETLKEIENTPLPTKEEYIASIEKVLADPNTSDEEKEQMRKARKYADQMIFEPLPQKMARMFLGTWKLQKHLYDQYGGGRILFQQFGLEAFDAMHRFIKEQEKQGHFKINDPKLRKALYAYWTNQEGSYALIDDPVRIHEEFLTPDWLPSELWPELSPVKAPKLE